MAPSALITSRSIRLTAACLFVTSIVGWLGCAGPASSAKPAKTSAAQSAASTPVKVAAATPKTPASTTPVVKPKPKRHAPNKPAGMFPLGVPLEYHGEFVDVTDSNTLYTRYASKDFGKDLDFYYNRAKADAKGRKPATIRMCEVFVKQFDVVARHPDNPGGKIEATCRIPERFITEAPEYEAVMAKTYYAYTDGALQIQWRKPIIIDKPLLYDQKQDNANQWWLDPKKIEDELLPFMKDIQPGDVDYFMFFLDPAVRKDDPTKKIWPSYGGMAYADASIKGAHFLTINDHEIARGTHEMGHHLYDTTVQETEHMTVTRFHGMSDAGYYGDEVFGTQKYGTLDLGPIMLYYRDCMRYFYPRDMWARWTLHGYHNIAHESFSGKTYRWADVKNDFWFKLPQISKNELRTLTGLKTADIATSEADLQFTVAPSEKIESPRLEGALTADIALNNNINLRTESTAVLKTAKGTFLFVKPQFADLYADMFDIRNNFNDGASHGGPIPAVGYILQDDKGLVVFKLPDNYGKLPADELGFFRTPPATVTVTGLAPDETRTFRKNLSVTIKPTDSSIKTIHYTLDNTQPTADSTAYSKPIELKDSAILRAAFFDAAGKKVGSDYRASYTLQPMDVKTTGVAARVPRTLFTDAVTITAKPTLPGVTLRYTTDGSEPTAASPAYDKPIQIKQDATVCLQAFSADGQSLGDEWKQAFSNKGFELNLATGKPASSTNVEGNDTPQKAVDGLATRDDGWWGAPGAASLTVDLQKVHNLDRAKVFTYYDGTRYYQYTLETYLDGKTWTMAADKSKNTTPSVEKGQEVTFTPRKARYVRLNMLHNSDNPAMHVLELRVYEK
jgi:hypothetical protein